MIYNKYVFGIFPWSLAHCFPNPWKFLRNKNNGSTFFVVLIFVPVFMVAS